MTKQHTSQDFKGFDDFIEVFRAGEHVASNGVKRTWTNDEIDQMVANHSAASAAPIVIGHPEHNDPAYGWVAQYKRDGGSLLAKFRDVNQDFASGVEKGSYRKRSIRVYKKPDGTFAIEHVGFLGAKRPAIDLDAMNYNAVNAEEVFDFEADWYTPNVVARTFRRLRDWIIGEHGLETADQVIPDWDITSLSNHSDELLNTPDTESNPTPSFNAPNNGGTEVTPEEHQAALDAARKEERETLTAQLNAEKRKNRQAEFAAYIKESNLTPAQAEGAVEFMHCLAEQEATEFEFSAGTENKKQAPLEWFKAFVKAVPQQVKTGEHDFEAADDDVESKTLVSAIGAGMK